MSYGFIQILLVYLSISYVMRCFQEPRAVVFFERWVKFYQTTEFFFPDKVAC